MMDQLQKRYSGCGLTCLVTTNIWSWFGVGGGEGGYSCSDGWESGWMVLGGQVQSQLLQHCCTSFVKASYLLRTRHGHQVTAAALHILQPSFFVWSLSLIMLSARNSDKHRWRLNYHSLNAGLLFLISSSVSSGLCVEFIVVTTKCEIHALAFCFGPCELWDIKLSARSASSAVEHFLCGKQNREKGMATFVDCLPQAQESCYEQIRCTCKQACRGRCKCFKAACCAQPYAYAVRTVTTTR